MGDDLIVIAEDQTAIINLFNLGIHVFAAKAD